MYDVNLIRNDFPMLRKQINGKPLVFLDNASTTLKPKVVIKAVNEYLEELTSNAHRGDYDIAHLVDLRVEETRANVANFINADAEEVVFTSGTSMSLNLVAYGYGVQKLKKGDEILVSEAEHASNLLPWFKVSEITGATIRYIPLDSEGRLTANNVKKTITKHTKVVSIAHVTNVLGFIIDIKKIAKIVHENGAILVVDGAQSVPHIKTNVKDLDIDFLTFSSHKMLGPTGLGVLYGKYELLEKMEPLLTGGGMNSRFNMCGEVKYYDPPRKFEAGTLNLEGIFGLNAAINYLRNLGMDNVRKHETEIRSYAIKKLKELDNIIIYNETAESGIITLNVKDVFAQDAATFFNSYGIAVRSGQHCAKNLISFLKTHSTIRMSIYLYTTKEEIDIFVEACKKGGNFLDVYF
ncbi:MAG TPA: SufS family cysteine desulfurase [Bacilli bacterium]|nr:SufS family cysteine desulfurase [Bacilli bacterium]